MQKKIKVTRFVVEQFDSETWRVIDTRHQGELCVCSNYDGATSDAKFRAEWIAESLNEHCEQVVRRHAGKPRKAKLNDLSKM